MKKKELETLEVLNKQRDLNENIKEIICKKVLKNFLLATAIVLFLLILRFIGINLDKQRVILVYKISSIVLLTLTIVLFEIAYKKDIDSITVLGIEMLLVSIVTLLTPYIFIQKPNIATKIIGIYFVIYYMLKNLIIYRHQKNEYLKQISDITEIVKKESQDELAKKHKEKRGQEEIKQKKKRTTRKKTKTSSKKEVQAEKDEKIEPKRKRGRPRKTTNS